MPTQNTSGSSSEEENPFLQDLYDDGLPPYPSWLPYRCDCRASISLQRETDGPNVGRQYYGCDAEYGSGHFHRYWEDAISGELERLGKDLVQLRQEFRCVFNVRAQQQAQVSKDLKEMKEAIRIRDDEIFELKDRIRKLEAVVFRG